MLQSLEVISINLWQILISLCNLLILFLIIKHFLYKPVKRVMAERKEILDQQYAAAANAQKEAESYRQDWEDKMKSAQTQADHLVQKAVTTADRRTEKILSDAKEKASSIVRQAEVQADLEQKKAESEIKKQIVDVSVALTEKMLHREIQPGDHRAMIDSFIEEMGEDSDRDS